MVADPLSSGPELTTCCSLFELRSAAGLHVEAIWRTGAGVADCMASIFVMQQARTRTAGLCLEDFSWLQAYGCLQHGRHSCLLFSAGCGTQCLTALVHSPSATPAAGLRVEDISRAGAVVADMRKIIRQDPRIIQKLHRRVFMDKLTRDQVSIYISCYIEAANRDAFMAVKQDLLLAFVDCVERNNARLARNRLQVGSFCTQGVILL